MGLVGVTGVAGGFCEGPVSETVTANGAGHGIFRSASFLLSVLLIPWGCADAAFGDDAGAGGARIRIPSHGYFLLCQHAFDGTCHHHQGYRQHISCQMRIGDRCFSDALGCHQVRLLAAA